MPDWKEAAEPAERIRTQIEPDFSAFKYRSSPNWFKKDQLTYKLILFVGAFISIVFFVAAGSFIYFRFYTDIQEDRAKYRSLRKIGMTAREAKRIVTVLLAILFFVPYTIATVHPRSPCKPCKPAWRRPSPAPRRRCCCFSSPR